MHYHSNCHSQIKCQDQARLPAPRPWGARFLLRAHYKDFCTKIIKSLERAGGAAAPLPPSVGVPGQDYSYTSKLSSKHYENAPHKICTSLKDHFWAKWELFPPIPPWLSTTGSDLSCGVVNRSYEFEMEEGVH